MLFKKNGLLERSLFNETWAKGPRWDVLDSTKTGRRNPRNNHKERKDKGGGMPQTDTLTTEYDMLPPGENFYAASFEEAGFLKLRPSIYGSLNLQDNCAHESSSHLQKNGRHLGGRLSLFCNTIEEVISQETKGGHFSVFDFLLFLLGRGRRRDTFSSRKLFSLQKII